MISPKYIGFLLVTCICFSHAKTIYLKSRLSIPKADTSLRRGRVEINNIIKPRIQIILKGIHRDGYLVAARRSHVVKCCGRITCRGGSGSGASSRKNMTSLRTKAGKRTEKNGPSQKLVKIGKSKYKFPSKKTSFKEAKKLCDSENLALLTIDNQEEMSKVTEYLQYIGTSNTPIFTQFLPAASSDIKWGTGSPPGGPGECLMQINGVFYNGSCDSVGNFACEEKPLPAGLTTTMPPGGLLESLADGVLNFVGGKNIIVPSERATKSNAANLCADQGLELMSFDSLTQLDSVQDFLGDIGISSSLLHTAMGNLGGDGSNWLGDLAAAVIPQKAPENDGNCMGLSGAGLMGVSCDMVMNFACQAPSPPNYSPLPSMSDIFNSFLPAAKADPIDIGGTEYLVPSEKVSSSDAKTLCGSRKMDLIKIETSKENSQISDFLTSQTIGFTPMLTALQPFGKSGGFSWNGETEAKNLSWADGEPSGEGNCTSFNKLGLSSVPCDAPINFMCENKNTGNIESTKIPISVSVQEDIMTEDVTPEPLEIITSIMQSTLILKEAMTLDSAMIAEKSPTFTSSAAGVTFAPNSVTAAPPSAPAQTGTSTLSNLYSLTTTATTATIKTPSTSIAQSTSAYGKTTPMSTAPPNSSTTKSMITSVSIIITKTTDTSTSKETSTTSEPTSTSVSTKTTSTSTSKETSTTSEPTSTSTSTETTSTSTTKETSTTSEPTSTSVSTKTTSTSTSKETSTTSEPTSTSTSTETQTSTTNGESQHKKYHGKKH